MKRDATSGKKRHRRLLLETLESRRLLATYWVTEVADSGAGSLRQAIIDANNHPGKDEILFDFTPQVGIPMYPVTGTLAIQVDFDTTPVVLPGRMAVIQPKKNLPAITDSVLIDGTMPGLTLISTPGVEIRGNLISRPASGLRVLADDCEIRGLSINSFNHFGIKVENARRNLIVENYIGIHAEGNGTSGNANGILLINAANNELHGNTIASNAIGVVLLDSDSNIVTGNTISNNTQGMLLTRSAANRIGGTDGRDANHITLSDSFGILIGFSESVGNQIINNAITNNEVGIQVSASAAQTQIGGSGPNMGNWIAGNNSMAIALYGRSTETRIEQNLIGTSQDGLSVQASNGRSTANGHGIEIRDSDDNEVIDNTIAGINPLGGSLYYSGFVTGRSEWVPSAVSINWGSSGNEVIGNNIGTDITGNASLPIFGNGITMIDFADNNQVTGNTIGSSFWQQPFGSGGSGLLIENSSGNVVTDNRVGTNKLGTAAIANKRGVYLYQADHNTLGGGPGQGNTISGNASYGIAIEGAEASENQVIGNYVGTNAGGDAAIPNRYSGIVLFDAPNNLIGGDSRFDGNTISGNGLHGVVLDQANHNQISNNIIGLDGNATINLGNQGEGVLIYGSSYSTINQNTISGNWQSGVAIQPTAESVASTHNLVVNNLIGTNLHGSALGNASGIFLNGSYNTIGGAQSDGNTSAFNFAGVSTYGRESTGNVISWNDIHDNIAGLYIKTSGETLAHNQLHDNTVGIDLSGSDATVVSNQIEHNEKGVLSTATRTIIGLPGQGNDISRNVEHGILFAGATDTSVQDNTIDGNLGSGIDVYLESERIDIGGTAGEGNRITNNAGAGIAVMGGTGTSIVGNTISGNDRLGIDIDLDGYTPNDAGDLDEGANSRQNFPMLTNLSVSDTETTLDGFLASNADSEYLIQVFANDLPNRFRVGQGQRLLGQAVVQTNNDGLATWQLVFGESLLPGVTVSATATQMINGQHQSTSEFSPYQRVPFSEQGVNTTLIGNQGEARIAALPGGGSVITWTGEGIDGYGIYARRWDSEGSPIDLEMKVNVGSVSDVAGMSVDADSNGRFVVSWSDTTQAFWRAFDSDGTPLGDVDIPVDSSQVGMGNQMSPSIALSDQGVVIVGWDLAHDIALWPDLSDVFVRRFLIDGTPIDPAGSVISQDTTDNQQDVQIGVDGDGDYVAAWTDYDIISNEANVFVRQFGSDGFPVGDQQRANTRDHDVNYLVLSPSLAVTAAGSFVVGWESCNGGSCFEASAPTFRRFGVDGTPVDGVEITTSARLGYNVADIGMADDGSVAITWDHQSDIAGNSHDVYAQKYFADGTHGDVFIVHDVLVSNQWRPQIAVSPQGVMSLVWESEGQDGDQGGVYTRQFDDRTDVQLSEFTADGASQFQVRYRIINSEARGPLRLSVYKSTQRSFDEHAQLLHSQEITAGLDLAVGDHELSFHVDNLGLTAPEPPDADDDYHLIAVLDPLDVITEQDLHPISEDNSGAFTGVFRLSDGTVVIQGSDTADQINVSPGSVRVRMNGREYRYASSAVASLTIHSHDGNDQVIADSMTNDLLVWSGAGNDVVRTGSGNDIVWAGPGNDEVSGGFGNDQLYGNGGDDHLSGGNGDDALDGGSGVNMVDPGQGNDQLTSYLELSFADITISENDGPDATVATVTRHASASLDQPRVVSIASDAFDSIHFPASVTIPAGNDSATFDIDAIDDQVLDGDQAIVLTATAAGFLGTAATLTVTDHEALWLDTPNDRLNETFDRSTLTASIVRSDPLSPLPLEVSLQVDDDTELTFPDTLTFQPGESIVEFELVGIDDGDLDGLQTVMLTVDAVGHDSSTAAIVIADTNHQTFGVETLSSGIGDGHLTVSVDGYGSFGHSLYPDDSAAVYDPVGGISPTWTASESALAIQFDPGSGFELLSWDAGLPLVPIVGEPTNATSVFEYQGLRFELHQSVSLLGDLDNGVTGAELIQTYEITNLGTSEIEFDLARYFDGAVTRAGTVQGSDDGGGRIASDSGSETLFQVRTNEDNLAVAIRAIGGVQPEQNRYDVAESTVLRQRLLSGAELQDAIHGDVDLDGFVDSGQEADLSVALRNQFQLGPLQTDVYTTRTIVGSGPPSAFVNSAPVAGDDEAVVTIPEQPYSIGVLINDDDTDGSLLSRTITIIEPPAFGFTIIDIDNGTIEYVGGPDLRETDEFRYAVADEEGTFTNTATVSIDFLPYQNPTDRFDVNSSGKPTSLDALQIINQLARLRNSGTPGVLPLPLESYPPERFYDVNGDRRCSGMDALLVLNFLNRMHNEANEEAELATTETSESASNAHSEFSQIPQELLFASGNRDVRRQPLGVRDQLFAELDHRSNTGEPPAGSKVSNNNLMEDDSSAHSSEYSLGRLIDRDLNTVAAIQWQEVDSRIKLLSDTLW